MNLFKIDDLLKLIRSVSQVAEIKNYIEKNNVKIKNLNNKNFDIILYVIEYCNDYNIIKYFIQECEYETFNYTIYNFTYHSSQVPLFTAIIKNKFKVADLLIKYGASINYCINNLDCRKISIVDYCCFIKKIKDFNRLQFNYILKKGFNKNNITSSLITKFVYNNRADLLETVFKHYIFDNLFILNLISFYKNKVPLSDNLLQNEIVKEKRKIEIDEEVYQKTLFRVNSDVLSILYDYDYDDLIMDRVQHYRILEKAVLSNNYSLVEKILNNKSLNSSSMSFNNNLLVQACRVYCGKSVMQLLVQSLLNKNCTDFKKSHNFENILLEASRMNRVYHKEKVDKSESYLETLKYLIEVLFNVTATVFNNKKSSLDFSFIKDSNSSYLSLILNALIKINDFELIQQLVENTQVKLEINLNSKDKNGEYPIITALDANAIKIFKYLIEHGANPNTIIRDNYRHGVSLLSSAISERKHEIVHYLLKKDIQFNENDACDDYTRSLIKENYQDYPHSLINAIYKKDKKTVQYLITPLNNENTNECSSNSSDYEISRKNYLFLNKKKIDTSFKFKHKFTALIFSYLLGNIGIFKILSKKFDINEKDGYGNTMLYYAILKEDILMIYYLIQLGIDVNYVIDDQNLDYHYALEIAIVIGNKNIFYRLLNHNKIDLNLMNNKKESLLMTIIKSHLFSEEDKISMMKDVLKKGSRVNLLRLDCYSPLLYAIQENSLSMTTLLIDHGANINFINKIDGKSPLEFAIQKKSLALIKLLIEKGANININVGGGKSSLLWYALKQGDLSIVDYLMKNHIDLDIKDDISYSDLVEASSHSGLTSKFNLILQHNSIHITSFLIQQIISNNRLDLLKILLNNHLNVEQKDSKGNTILANAIKSNNISIVNYLIEWGADLHSVNLEGKSIYDICYSNCNNYYGRYIYQKINGIINHL